MERVSRRRGRLQSRVTRAPDSPFRSASVASASLRLWAVLADVTLETIVVRVSTEVLEGQMSTHESRAVIAFRALDAIAGQVTYTTASVAAKRRAESASFFRPVSRSWNPPSSLLTSTEGTVASTAAISAATLGIGARTSDVANLSAAVALGTR